MTRPIVVVVGARYPDVAIEQNVLAGLDADVTLVEGETENALVAACRDADVVLAGTAPRFTSSVLERIPAVGIVRYGVGLDNVDLDAAARLGKWVVSTPGHGTETVALHTLTLILAALRRLPEADRTTRSGSWGFGHLRPLHLPEALTIGIVGFGRIGRRLAELTNAVGFARVVAHDPLAPVDAPGVESSGLGALVATCDVVTIHAPGTADDAPLFGPEMMAKFKQGSVLVNCARGSLIDAAALAAGLASGAPAAAALDVFAGEPPDLTPFAGVADRIIMTPHMAWYAEESEAAVRRDAAEQARRILTGRHPDHAAVTPEGLATNEHHAG